MTVGELIEKLTQLPKDTLVFREGSEYKGDEIFVTEVTYRTTVSWGVSHAPSVLIK